MYAWVLWGCVLGGGVGGGGLRGRSVGPLRNADGACIGVFVCVCKRVMDVMLVCCGFRSFHFGSGCFL